MINSEAFKQHAQRIMQYQKIKDQIKDLIDKSRMSKQKKWILKDLITNLLLIQEEITLFDHY